jgi:predicted NBD/HSP70 family sugar kinase
MTATEIDPESSASLDAGSAALLGLLRRDGPLTRAEMTAATGWARVTVTSRLERLLDSGLLVADEPVNGQRGRPAVRYRLNAARAVLLVADIGASGMRLARVDLDGRVEATEAVRAEIGDGPDDVLKKAREALVSLAGASGDRPVWGLAVSLPGPVDFAAGRVVTPPIMIGWDGVPVRDILKGWFRCPVLVENDANAMALGEQASRPATSDLLAVKVGTGLGCGIISGGRVMRGDAGAAGDIGHTWADVGQSASEPPDCRCGKRGCVEAYVGGWAIARDVSATLGRDVDVDGVVELLRAGDATTVRLVRDAGRVLGASLATAVSLLNPSTVVLSGQVAVAAGDHLLAGLRERIYTRALPLATRHLDISISTLWPDSGIHGLARGIADVVLTEH